MIHSAVVFLYQFGCRYMNLKVVWEFMWVWPCSFCSIICSIELIFYSDKGLGWAAILGIVLGCLAFVVIVLVVVVVCCYYCNNRERYGDRYSRGGGRPYGAYSNRGYSNMQNYKVGHCLCMMQSKWHGCTQSENLWFRVSARWLLARGQGQGISGPMFLPRDRVSGGGEG